jgi:hypothetical protein
MLRFEVRQSAKTQLTSCAGVALIGPCCEAAQVDLVVDPRWPVSQGIRTSDIVKSVIGLLSMGKSDFDAIEAFRKDSFFQQSLGLNKVPSSAWLRQRLDAVAGDLRERVAEMTQRLLERTEAPVTGHQGFVCVDVDTFAMDNSGTRKEHVGRTYQGFHGYTPVAAYMGNEGWCVGLEWVQNAQSPSRRGLQDRARGQARGTPHAARGAHMGPNPTQLAPDGSGDRAPGHQTRANAPGA